MVSPDGQPQFLQSVLASLAPVGPIRAHPTKVGTELHHNGKCFAVVRGKRLYLRAGPASRSEFRRRGAPPIGTDRGVPMAGFSLVPTIVLNDDVLLTNLARRAIHHDGFTQA